MKVGGRRRIEDEDEEEKKDVEILPLFDFKF